MNNCQYVRRLCSLMLGVSALAWLVACAGCDARFGGISATWNKKAICNSCTCNMACFILGHSSKNIIGKPLLQILPRIW